MKTPMTLTLAIVLFSTVAISQTVSFASANFRPWEPLLTTIDVESPIYGEYYPSNDTWLNFTVVKTSDWINKTNSQIKFVTYCVDGYCDGVADEKEIIVEVHDAIGDVNAPSSFSFSFRLGGLKEGQHTVNVLVKGVYEGTAFETPSWWGETFLVDDGVPPEISLLSAENKTYSTANIPLTYLTNEQVARVTYALDGKYVSYLSGNMTLTDLPEGSHTIAVYAYDVSGNRVSDTVYFTVSPLPVVLTLVLAAAVAIFGIMLFVYFKKRQRSQKP
jgi:hypothetical protein